MVRNAPDKLDLRLRICLRLWADVVRDHRHGFLSVRCRDQDQSNNPSANTMPEFVLGRRSDISGFGLFMAGFPTHSLD